MSGHFTEKQQDEIREKLFCTGLEYLKKYGMQKMTVDKLTAAAGIAKGSFYNFYKSKEEFLFALSEYAGGKMKEMLMQKLNGRKKLTVEEFIEFLEEYLYSDYDIMSSLTVDDFLWAKKHLAAYHAFEPNSQLLVMRYFFGIIENVSEDADPGVAANLIKCIYAIREHRDTMVCEALDKSIEVQLHAIGEYLKYGNSRK